MWLRMSRRAGASSAAPGPRGARDTFLSPPFWPPFCICGTGSPPSPAGLTWGCGGSGSSSSRRETAQVPLVPCALFVPKTLQQKSGPRPSFLPALGPTLLAVGEERGEGGIQRVGPSLKLNPHFRARPGSPPGSGAPRTCPWAMAGLRPLV